MWEGTELNTEKTLTFGGQSGLKKRKIILIVIAVMVVVALAVALLAYFLTRKSSKNQVETVEMHAGVVRGRREGKALVFKGIPYAKPSSGEQRWKPPVPCRKDTCWRGTFDAEVNLETFAPNKICSTRRVTLKMSLEVKTACSSMFGPQRKDQKVNFYPFLSLFMVVSCCIYLATGKDFTPPRKWSSI